MKPLAYVMKQYDLSRYKAIQQFDKYLVVRKKGKYKGYWVNLDKYEEQNIGSWLRNIETRIERIEAQISGSFIDPLFDELGNFDNE